MKRRAFLGTAALGAATAAAASFPAPAIAKGKRQLKMVTTWPKNFPGLGTSPERIAKRVEAATDGELSIRVYAAQELVGAFQAFDAVSRGAADMYHGAEYYWQGKHKAFNFFTAVPMGLTAVEMIAWINYLGGQKLWDELSARFNIKAVMATNTGTQMGGWFRKEINSLDDLQGLKMRIPGLGGEVMRRLGVATVAVPGGEIYTSLQQGQIDATEWVGPWNDLAFGFHKVAPHYYCPGIHEPGALLAVGFNLDVWNSLSNSHKTIVRAICHADHNDSLGEFAARNAQSLLALKNKHKIEPKSFSPEILQAMAKASDEVLQEIREEDEISKRIYDSFYKARQALKAYFEIAEQPYMNLRSEMPFGPTS